MRRRTRLLQRRKNNRIHHRHGQFRHREQDIRRVLHGECTRKILRGGEITSERSLDRGGGDRTQIKGEKDILKTQFW